MSAQAPVKRITAPQIADRKGSTPIVALTAYTAPMAAMVDAHADLILVGDSLGMVVHGLPSTIGVTIDADNETSTLYDVAGAASFASGSQVKVNLAQVSGSEGDYVIAYALPEGRA
mgnify:CR=1 FL=1